MTNHQIIHQKPFKAYHRLIDTFEKRQLFNKLQEIELKEFFDKPYTTLDMMKATKKALIVMHDLKKI